MSAKSIALSGLAAFFMTTATFAQTNLVPRERNKKTLRDSIAQHPQNYFETMPMHFYNQKASHSIETYGERTGIVTVYIRSKETVENANGIFIQQEETGYSDDNRNGIFEEKEQILREVQLSKYKHDMVLTDRHRVRLDMNDDETGTLLRFESQHKEHGKKPHHAQYDPNAGDLENAFAWTRATMLDAFSQNPEEATAGTKKYKSAIPLGKTSDIAWADQGPSY